jgi:hypothetical protein
MWKTIRIHTESRWLKVKAFVCRDWAAHKTIGVSEDRDPGYDWTVTYVPSGLRIGTMGSVNAQQAIRVATQLGVHCSGYKDVADLVEDEWLAKSIIAQAIDEAIAMEAA